ncbi:uncharacterized protein LOC102368497 isoform X2 [Alligator sinensis]|uniref:Uncharacterized protein LOC102368497 isoform X2 n=1 Tax=Alligator sinensis TaxID=38654 RepID=A0A3Q0FTB3_ALLSI|nr:uncharacterized protein LOC102368497 isoform X2 [Alligator sinensis]
MMGVFLKEPLSRCDRPDLMKNASHLKACPSLFQPCSWSSRRYQPQESLNTEYGHRCHRWNWKSLCRRVSKVWNENSSYQQISRKTRSGCQSNKKKIWILLPVSSTSLFTG